MSHENNFWNESFLTVADVATHLNVSKMSIYRLIRAGELEAVSVGHTLRVGKTAVDGYLNQSRVAGVKNQATAVL